VAALALAVALPLVALFGLGAGGGGSGYEVRAVFDNVAAAVPGEDVKVAGAKVGVIESMDVTKDNKAAVKLRIDDEKFTPFRTDASCTVRPQSLIGEKFVECTPGTPAGDPLEKIDEGDGKGQHLLPVDNTSSPVDLDLVNDILRLPYRERLAILLNELGTGLAGRGKDLNEVIHRSNPALRETDKVLKTLAGQNRVLARLAVDSDQVLAPLARERRRVSDWIVQADATAEATAERSGDISGSVERLPRFLSELNSLMANLEGFADQATPVTAELGDAAPAVNRLVRELGPFSREARPAIRSLGTAAARGRPALLKAAPLVTDLRRVAHGAVPLSLDLDNLTASLDRTDSINRIADYFFFQMTAINGFDSMSHYLRIVLLANACALYATAPSAACNANFSGPKATTSSTRSAAAQVAKAASRSKGQGSVPLTGSLLQGLLGQGQTPEAARQGRKNVARIRRQARQPSPAFRRGGDPTLDYLLGGER
jgi:phospholipid/cholesterol/gamma-HCH transport system substrate-binding protein